jgi:hypothetical protein
MCSVCSTTLTRTIVLIPDLGLNQLKEHVELELTITFGTFEVKKKILRYHSKLSVSIIAKCWF